MSVENVTMIDSEDDDVMMVDSEDALKLVA